MANEKVRLAIMAPTLNMCNFLFSVEEGFFRREGLDVEIMVRPGLRNTEALERGEADFGAANECVIQTALKGPTELRILLNALKDPLHDLLVQRDIGALADLKGKRVATPASGSTPAVQTRLFFTKEGFEPDRDIFLVPQSPAETMADRVRKFEDGEYAGLIASPPVPFFLNDKGYRTITELSTHFPGTASHGLVTTVNRIADRRPMVEAMVRGYVRGVTALKQDCEAALDFISRRFSLERPIAVRGYELMRDRWTAELSLESFRTEIEFHARRAGVAPIAPETVMDASFVSD